jgi:heat shock protein HslJ
MRLSKLLLAGAFLTLAIGQFRPPSFSLPRSVSFAADSRLASTEWNLVSFGMSGRDSPVSEGRSVTLKFGSDGRAGGSGGCNSYSGQYREQGQQLSFSSILSTKRACVEQRANQQEQQYFAALETARSFRLSGERLTIVYGNGRSVLNFVRDSPAPTPDQKYENRSSPVDLLASFYDAVSNRDYERAYSYWETPPGNLQGFKQGYRDTVSVQLIVQPPTRIEGAAGSMYAEVPTLAVASQRNGTRRLYVGCYVVRKSNVRPSDSAVEDVWRIYKASLSQVAVGAGISPKVLSQACAK